jgi:sulfide:quinone oxidoreductase
MFPLTDKHRQEVAMARILVLGGGFGGLAAAHRLRDALDEDHEITLVDRRDRFFIGLVKLWDMVGIASLEKESRSLRGLETKGIKFLQADITDLDPEVRRVETSAGTLSADFMVVALGAAFFPGHTVMLQGSAHHLYDAGNLPAIRRDLATIQEGRIVIGVMGVPYKCPPAPYEAALLNDDLLRGENKRDRVEISVYTPQPSSQPVAGRKGSALVSAALGEKGIALHTEHQITGIEGSSGSVSFANGTSAEFTLFLGVAQHVATGHPHRQLNQPGTVYAETRDAAPQIGRAEQGLGDGDAVRILLRSGGEAEADVNGWAGRGGNGRIER